MRKAAGLPTGDQRFGTECPPASQLCDGPGTAAPHLDTCCRMRPLACRNAGNSAYFWFTSPASPADMAGPSAGDVNLAVWRRRRCHRRCRHQRHYGLSRRPPPAHVLIMICFERCQERMQHAQALPQGR